MEYIYIGKIVNTHGIKGELRILSDFEYKERVFRKGFNLYIGKDKIKEEINTYRHHKEFEMVTFNEYNNINQVLKYLKENVYILKEDLNLGEEEYLEKELIGFDVIENNEVVGKIINIEKTSPTNKIMEINYKGKRVLLPYHKDFILKLDLQNKKIEVKLIEGMI
ncbi:MAG: 16S rRNA processing protein RimM [Firmicutes bacterium]|nr:16S rRNA processing protein RimM [Bacillota bacterium]